jgi:hypothetical protein
MNAVTQVLPFVRAVTVEASSEMTWSSALQPPPPHGPIVSVSLSFRPFLAVFVSL